MDDKLKMSMAIADLEDAKNLMFRLLDKHLSHPAKDYQIVYKGKEYRFVQCFDPEDIVKVTRLRHRFIKDLIKCSIKKSLSGTGVIRDGAWDNIFGIMGGANPADHQIEKYTSEDAYEIVGDNGERITSVPLNLDNYQVKENLGMLDDKQN